MKYDNQLRYASEIVKKYDGKIPLSAWLKNYFRLNKQMGSRDRKTLSEMVYGFYRLGGNVFDSVEERLLSFIAISENLPAVKDYFFEGEKNTSLKNGVKISVDEIFSYTQHLSNGIEADNFSKSFLVQPDLFVRIRPGNKQNVLEKFKEGNVLFKELDDNCISLPNSTKVESLIELDKEGVIQDKSSQDTATFFREFSQKMPTNAKVWDCCAASGGKSILAYDILDKPIITVSDIRESIIHNLDGRFNRAGISYHSSFVTDLTSPQTKIPASVYDLVIADVPCSGSGTWARTPEQLYFFKEERIAHYSGLQKKIISRVASSMKAGGYLLYITCSVFAEENEKNTDYFRQNFGLTPVKSELIKGYNQKADTLYAVLFTNRSA